MPVHGHAKRLLTPQSAASPGNRADRGIDLIEQTIVEAKLCMASHLVAYVGADKPGIEVGRGCTGRSKAGIEGVASICRSGPKLRGSCREPLPAFR